MFIPYQWSHLSVALAFLWRCCLNLQGDLWPRGGHPDSSPLSPPPTAIGWEGQKRRDQRWSSEWWRHRWSRGRPSERAKPQKHKQNIFMKCYCRDQTSLWLLGMVPWLSWTQVTWITAGWFTWFLRLKAPVTSGRCCLVCDYILTVSHFPNCEYSNIIIWYYLLCCCESWISQSGINKVFQVFDKTDVYYESILAVFSCVNNN